jgi:hypothetical protein
MQTIWKFPLDMRGWKQIVLPALSTIVLTGIDPASGAPAIWVELEVTEDGGPDGDPVIEGEVRTRWFGVFPTGGRIAENARHVGSMIDRSFVWHIYERIDPAPAPGLAHRWDDQAAAMGTA